FEGGFVLGRHQVQAELVTALGSQRQADQAASLLGHEVDRLGCGELGREREVALVLAVLVVAHHDHAPAADVLDRLLDGGERGGGSPRAHLCPAMGYARTASSRSTCLARMSTSTFTIEPSRSRPRVVRASVSGISDTAKP